MFDYSVHCLNKLLTCNVVQLKKDKMGDVVEFFKNSDWHLTDCFLMKGKELQNYLMISFWSGFK